MTVYLHSLGCDKNLVDSELILGQMLKEGFTLTSESENAEVIIVNTCGFIKEAVEEGIEYILQMAANKKEGACKALIATGCLVQRYKDDVLEEIAEIDAIIGVNDFPMVAQVVKNVLAKEPIAASPSPPSPIDIFDEEMYERRYFTAPFHIGYIKIAEGCDNRCTYCAIPAIRGSYRSRAMESILAECERMLASGAKELVLIAQDTSRWGVDIYGEPRLHKLLQAITELPESTWVRCMYAYPIHVYGELIEEIANNPKVCSYLDMPIQHSHDAVLQRMGRKETNKYLRETIEKIRQNNIMLRTTVIVGFPGETEEEFAHLCEFLEEIKFDHLGCFMYSREEGTAAAALPEQVPMRVKRAREEAVMTLQSKIVYEGRKAFLDRELDVIVDGTVWEEEETLTYAGRSYADAYEIDGATFFTSDREIISGELVKVKITEVHGYDLKGELL